MVLALPIKMHREGEVFRRRELRKAALEFQSVGAEVDVLLARDEAFDDLDDLRMKQRLPARDGDHGRATFIDGRKALFRGELLLQNMRRILHLAAPGTG